MKKSLVISLIMVFTLIAYNGIAYSADTLSGTYVTKNGSASYTFSGNTLTTIIHGAKRESMYTVKDGILSFTNTIGRAVATKYKLEGNKLTIDGTELFKK